MRRRPVRTASPRDRVRQDRPRSGTACDDGWRGNGATAGNRSRRALRRAAHARGRGRRRGLGCDAAGACGSRATSAATSSAPRSRRARRVRVADPARAARSRAGSDHAARPARDDRLAERADRGPAGLARRPHKADRPPSHAARGARTRSSLATDLDPVERARLEARRDAVRGELAGATQGKAATTAEARTRRSSSSSGPRRARPSLPCPRRFDRSLGRALEILAWEAIAVVMAVLVLAPLALVGLLAWVGCVGTPPARRRACSAPRELLGTRVEHAWGRARPALRSATQPPPGSSVAMSASATTFRGAPRSGSPCAAARTPPAR